MLPTILRTGLVIMLDDGTGNRRNINLAHSRAAITPEILDYIDTSIRDINARKITDQQWVSLFEAHPEDIASKLGHQANIMLDTMVSERELRLINHTRLVISNGIGDDYEPCVFDGICVDKEAKTVRFDMENGDEYTLQVPIAEFLDGEFAPPYEILPYTVFDVRALAQFSAEEMNLARSFGNRDNVRSEQIMVYNTLVLGLMELLWSIKIIN